MTEGGNVIQWQAAAEVETALPSIPRNPRLPAGHVGLCCVARPSPAVRHQKPLTKAGSWSGTSTHVLPFQANLQSLPPRDLNITSVGRRANSEVLHKSTALYEYIHGNALVEHA